MPLLPWPAILDRLRIIFPEGTPTRNYLVRDMTARTIFTALYVDAVEGRDRWIAPRHVVRMGDPQAADLSPYARDAYYATMSAAKAPSPAARWYAENTREPLRDEVIRQGLVPVNAMIERQGLSTTSPAGRYALARDFAALFDPSLAPTVVAEMAATWRAQFLSAAALARAALVRASANTAAGNITVQCPGGPSIVLPPGPSPAITKAVIEVFAPAFLANPRVAWISDSARKAPFRDAPLERALGIPLDAAELLPDIVLVDLDPPGRPNRVLLVFVEVVASDGPVTAQRQNAIVDLVGRSSLRFTADDLAFVTAYADRGHEAVRRTYSQLAWRSFAWFASEPRHLLQLHDDTVSDRKLSSLL